MSDVTLEAVNGLEKLTCEEIQKLRNSLERYKRLIGLESAVTPYEKEILSTDRKNYVRFIPVGKITKLDMKTCTAFLVSVTGMAPDCCESYILSNRA